LVENSYLKPQTKEKRKNMCTGQVSNTDPSPIKSFQGDPLGQKDLSNGGLNGLNPQKRMQFQYKFRHFSVKQPGCFEANQEGNSPASSVWL